MQENHDIFREKLSVTVSLQRPRRCHRALMAFYPIPTVFMVEILCALTVLSLYVHGARRWVGGKINWPGQLTPHPCN